MKMKSIFKLKLIGNDWLLNITITDGFHDDTIDGL